MDHVQILALDPGLIDNKLFNRISKFVAVGWLVGLLRCSSCLI